MKDNIIEAVRLDEEQNEMVILDQTLLPAEKKFIRLVEMKDVWEAIYSLRVRGAPAIGIAAAYGVYIGTNAVKTEDVAALYDAFKDIKKYLASSRPTAVNLFWALDRMEKRFMFELENSPIVDVLQIKAALKDEAVKIHIEDEQVCKSIGEFALTLLKPGMGILTHCNAGTIATAKYGTALSAIYLGHEKDYDFKVFADETRPLLQGARLTAWELNEAGVDVTLICDNMASIVMKEGKIQAAIVGCDRVAANGDAANKIGTSGVAILAQHYGIPFYVCAPLSTIDMSCEAGDSIHIELRPAEEITEKWYEIPMAPKGVKVYNPCFDVTDHKLITAIITEKGIVYPPYNENLRKIANLK